MTSPRVLPLEDGGELVLVEGWLSPAEAGRFEAALMREIPRASRLHAQAMTSLAGALKQLL